MITSHSASQDLGAGWTWIHGVVRVPIPSFQGTALRLLYDDVRNILLSFIFFFQMTYSATLLLIEMKIDIHVVIFTILKLKTNTVVFVFREILVIQ